MNRTERRAAERQARKLDRKAGFPNTTTTAPEPLSTPAAEDTLENTTTTNNIPEPGFPFPSLDSMAPQQQPPPTPRPISEAQRAANRANAQHSTGAKTEAGRQASAQNRTVHGLARHNGAFRLLPTEDANGFEALKAAFAAEHQPTTETEAILVNKMAESHWLANRAQRFMDACCDEQTGQPDPKSQFSLYLRYQTTQTRAFHKCLNDLLKLRAERRKEANGFEAQKRLAEQTRIKTEQHEMKKRNHYWDVLLKDGKACYQLAVNAIQQMDAAKQDPGFVAQYAAELANRGLKKGETMNAATAR